MIHVTSRSHEEYDHGMKNTWHDGIQEFEPASSFLDFLHK